MPNNLTPRVQAYRNALRKERETREEQANIRTNPNSPDPWRTKNKPEDWDNPLQGVDDVPAAPSGTSSDPWAEPDKGFGPVADSQAAGTSSLHDALEHAAEDDSVLEEALEVSLQQTRGESGPQAERTRQAAQRLASQIKDSRISAIAKEFVARSKAETGTEYCVDAEGANYVLVLQEINRQHNAGVLVDLDDTETAARSFFAKGLWTVPTLLAAWAALVQRGDVAYLLEGARPISNSERRAAMVQAASGDVQGAIISLLQIALPSIGQASTPQEIYAAIADPDNHDVLLDAVVSCWGATAAALAVGYRDTGENRQAIDTVLGDRPITVDNIRQAWEEVKRSRRPASLPEQSAAAANRPPSADDLDSLSDSEVSDLLGAVTRDRARNTRRRLL